MSVPVVGRAEGRGAGSWSAGRVGRRRRKKVDVSVRVLQAGESRERARGEVARAMRGSLPMAMDDCLWTDSLFFVLLWDGSLLM